MTEDISFDRIIVPLSLRPISRLALQFIAQLARALGLELLVQFQRDENLLALAGMPGMREFRIQQRAWQKFEIGQLPLDLDLAAGAAERLFREVSRASGITGRFEITALAHGLRVPGSTQRDIHVVYEPEDPVERLGYSLLQSIETQLAAGTTFLVMPGKFDLRSTHLTALLPSQADPAMVVARRIAEASGMTPQVMEIGASADLSAFIANPVFAQSRLVVTGRLPSDQAARLLRDLATLGSVPVLRISKVVANHNAGRD